MSIARGIVATVCIPELAYIQWRTLHVLPRFANECLCCCHDSEMCELPSVCAVASHLIVLAALLGTIARPARVPSPLDGCTIGCLRSRRPIPVARIADVGFVYTLERIAFVERGNALPNADGTCSRLRDGLHSDAQDRSAALRARAARCSRRYYAMLRLAKPSDLAGAAWCCARVGPEGHEKWHL